MVWNKIKKNSRPSPRPPCVASRRRIRFVCFTIFLNMKWRISRLYCWLFFLWNIMSFIYVIRRIWRSGIHCIWLYTCVLAIFCTFHETLFYLLIYLSQFSTFTFRSTWPRCADREGRAACWRRTSSRILDSSISVRFYWFFFHPSLKTHFSILFWLFHVILGTVFMFISCICLSP